MRKVGIDVGRAEGIAGIFTAHLVTSTILLKSCEKLTSMSKIFEITIENK